MTRNLHLALLTLLLAGFAVGCGDGSEAAVESGEIRVAEAFTPVPPNPEVASAYLVIENGSDVDDELVGASTDVAGAVEIHHTVEDGDGRSMMEEVERLAVPAGATVTLEPGGLHLMLLQVSEELQIDDTFDLELDFSEAGEITVPVTVVSLDALVSGAGGETGDHGSHPAAEPQDRP